MNYLASDARKIEAGVLIELYSIDLSIFGGPVLYFHPYNRLAPATITFQGLEYQPWPITSEGWAKTTRGTLPRPTLTISNIGSAVSGLLAQYEDFVGAKVTRRRTLERFLDGQPDADPTQEFSPDIYSVERKVSESRIGVQLELSSPFDTEGVKLPARQVLPGCKWGFRSPECTYVGPPLADEDNETLVALVDKGAHNPATVYAIGDYAYVMVAGIRVHYVSLADGNTSALTDKTKWTREACAHNISACRRYHGADQPLPYGGFLGATKLTQVG